MKSLSINGHMLHKIQMLLEPYSNGVVTLLQYPKHRIQYEQNENEVVLRIPSMLALELYRKGILSADEDSEVVLGISGRKIGNYAVDDFRYSNDHSNTVKIVFKRNKF